MSTIDKLRRGIVPEFTPGEQKWDYLYSGDAAQAFQLLGEKGTDGKTYVLGSGQAHPLADYIRTIQNAVNPDAEIRMGALPYPPGQVMHLEADITELKNDIGFKPQMRFTDGIRKIIE